MPPILNAQGLTKAFGATALFREISFTVSDGDRIGLIGPNGAGKSTLLKVLAGDEDADAGDVISKLICEFPGIDEITPAGSLRRGRETVGDLDLLVTGPACEPDIVSAAVEYVAALPLIDKLLAKGQNKVSFTLRNNLQVDVRLLPRSGYGAALQYFTGSKMHNVALRQRAIKRGLTLNEYALLRVEDNTIIAAASEADIYNALDLDYVPPELRENSGELEAAAAHTLPHLITLADIRGDLHMHTDATDGRDTIRQMAEAALARGLKYIAITDHSKNLAMTNGMDDDRALAHIENIRKVDAEIKGQHQGKIRVLAGIEVDILGDGTLDLEDETLAQMDIVVASVHSHFNQSIEEMTTRVLRALENPYVRILGHPTGRKVLGREGYAINIDLILKRAAELGVAVEHNASPARSDLNDLNLRLAKQYGCKIVVDTDAHSTEELDQMRYGITQLRRAWLAPADILNTQPTAEDLLQNLRPKP
jgi:DNA polymerase (family 10)